MVIDVHCFSLDPGAERLRELTGSLSAEERHRAGRFRFDQDRNRFIVCRGTLRNLLGIKPDENFAYGIYGKPCLPDSEIRFNVSHSHGMAMIAMARGREVGCDVERIDADFADENIPERFFSPYEVRSLRALPAKDQCDAFFRCWTRKEAYIKACGMGMSLALDSFDVTLEPDQPAALLRGAAGWEIQNVDVPEGYAGAIVIQDRRKSPRSFQPATTIATSSLISLMRKSGGAPAKVWG